MSKEHQHDGGVALLQGGDHVGRMSHRGVLLLDARVQENPGLVLDVEHPQLAGHVPRGIHLTAVHVHFALWKGEAICFFSQDVKYQNLSSSPTWNFTS